MRCTTWLSVASTLLPGLCQELLIQPIRHPELDLSLSNNGQVGLVGDFDSISSYTYAGMSNFTNQNILQNQLYYTTGDNDQFISLAEVHGTISSIFTFTSDCFLLVGDFESIGTYNESGPAVFNASTGEFSELSSGLNGTINAVLFNASEGVVYIGGDITFNNTNGVALYNLTSGELQSTLFEGFGDNSIVNSIVQIDDNIVFGGQFDTLGLSGLLSQSSNQSNITIETDQLVSLRSANFSSANPAGETSDPSVLMCPDGEEWSIASTTATLEIGLPYDVLPSKIRIYNSADADSQISIFRLITSPANGIMNLTYVDPSTGELAVCDAWCPLLASEELDEFSSNTTKSERYLQFGDSSVGWQENYQEFAFVNSIDVSSLQFVALDSHGSSIALAGFEIFQSLFSTYAVNSLNEPACGAISHYSFSETTGDWSTSASGSYLMTDITVSDNIPDVGVVFHPNITYAGDYNILVYTPGCTADNTCDYRGIVNVTLIDDLTNDSIQTMLIYQTNTENKYDTVFDGHLDGSVRVQMEAFSTVLSGSTSQLTVVADRISTSILSIDPISSTNGSVPINGIFEYSPANFTNFNAANLSETVIVGNSSINTLGNALSSNANVHLAYLNETLFLAGDFSSSFGDNFFEASVHSGNATAAVVAGGLNGAVSSLAVVVDSLIILGEFDNTNNATSIQSIGGDSIHGSVLYNGSWYSFGSTAGSQFNNLTLIGNEYWVFDNAVFDASKNSWFEPSKLLSFNSSASARNGNATLFTGSLKTADALANKGVLFDALLTEVNITNDTLSGGVIDSALFVNESLAVYGGKFVTASNITNLLLVSQNATTGLDINWNDDVSVTGLFALDEKLFIGTNGSGTVDEDDFGGILIYNLDNGTFQSVGALSKLDGSLAVNGFGYFNNTYLVVGGAFDSADSTECSGFCFYNMNNTSWTQLIENFSGSVNAFRFVNSTVIAVGDMIFNDKATHLFAYDFNSTNHTQPSHFSDVESELRKFILVDDTVDDRIIVSDGSSISAYDGSDWHNITGELSGSITDITLLDLATRNHGNDGSLFSASQVLIASGNLTIGSYGYANVALFNSTSWSPYMVATQGNATATVNSIYLNKDISNMFISGSVTNTTRSSTSSPAVPKPSETLQQKKSSNKLGRGFIVLVGLACAVATMGVLGAAGALILFRQREQEYTPLQPRVNETEMLDTVPPENLLKHV